MGSLTSDRHTQSNMKCLIILAALVAVACASVYAPKGKFYYRDPYVDAVDVKRQSKVNHIARAYGAGVGTADIDGVPGTKGNIAYGYGRLGYGHGYGKAYGLGYGYGKAYGLGYGYGKGYGLGHGYGKGYGLGYGYGKAYGLGYGHGLVKGVHPY